VIQLLHEDEIERDPVMSRELLERVRVESIEERRDVGNVVESYPLPLQIAVKI
jgi:hypothetical protein